ncbi:2'-5' RNA ligase, partial [Oceanicola granulosus HTCC2516]
MRAFVALDLPAEAVAILGHLQERMPSGRPVAPENLHMTLAFLGENVAEDVLEAAHDQFAAIRLPAPEIEVTGLGTLGARTPAVLVAEARRTAPLEALQGAVASAARRAGLVLERRRFRPHITLARFRSTADAAALERLRLFLQSEGRFRLDPFIARSFALYASTLTHEGPVYEELARYPLRGVGSPPSRKSTSPASTSPSARCP